MVCLQPTIIYTNSFDQICLDSTDFLHGQLTRTPYQLSHRRHGLGFEGKVRRRTRDDQHFYLSGLMFFTMKCKSLVNTKMFFQEEWIAMQHMQP